MTVSASRREQKQTTNLTLTLRIFLLLNIFVKLTSSFVHSPSFTQFAALRMTMGALLSSDDLVAQKCSESTQNAFRGKDILLTGASGGLGRALALQLAHCGAKTLVLSARNEASLQEVADECTDISPTTTIHTITCDLSIPDSVTELGHKAIKLCNVDVLINNGGVSSRSRFVDTLPEVDATVMQINFLSGSTLAKAVVPGMIERNSGAIIWISSVQGLFGLPERTSYAASKFAVQGYCEALRGELASSGVSVHCASPGYIRTNLSKSAVTGDGTPHGKMDSATASGADPNQVAVDILQAVAKGKADFVVAATSSAKVAPWLRFFLPSVWNKILVDRYEKSRRTENASSSSESKND
mmetsp:Transcript_23646/g.42912  ORF Transcript_23646/g.42912 Transcript_23646/m.42912 type:complete len:356 (-) Transcript_23646:25-1092(-)